MAERRSTIHACMRLRVGHIEILELKQESGDKSSNIFLGKEHLVKNRLISTLDKVIYFKGTIFQRSTKPLFTSQNRVEISCKNFSLFSNMLLLAYTAPKISMVVHLRAILNFNLGPQG
jgi:hypothetical protein